MGHGMHIALQQGLITKLASLVSSFKQEGVFHPNLIPVVKMLKCYFTTSLPRCMFLLSGQNF